MVVEVSVDVMVAEAACLQKNEDQEELEGAEIEVNQI